MATSLCNLSDPLLVNQVYKVGMPTAIEISKDYRESHKPRTVLAAPVDPNAGADDKVVGKANVPNTNGKAPAPLKRKDILIDEKEIANTLLASRSGPNDKLSVAKMHKAIADAIHVQYGDSINVTTHFLQSKQIRDVKDEIRNALLESDPNVQFERSRKGVKRNDDYDDDTCDDGKCVKAKSANKKEAKSANKKEDKSAKKKDNAADDKTTKKYVKAVEEHKKMLKNKSKKTKDTDGKKAKAKAKKDKAKAKKDKAKAKNDKEKKSKDKKSKAKKSKIESDSDESGSESDSDESGSKAGSEAGSDESGSDHSGSDESGSESSESGSESSESGSDESDSSSDDSGSDSDSSDSD